MTQWQQQTLTITTDGRGFYELTDEVAASIRRSGIDIGLAHVFIQHTSASLCLTENADPQVRADLERWAQRIVPDGDPLFLHDAEGDDDMPAHVRSLLSGSMLSVPIGGGRLLLGAWQGIYVWEHRYRRHLRHIILTLHGEPR